MVVWVGFNCKFIKNKIEKLKRSMYYPEGFAPCDLTRPGQRPSEFCGVMLVPEENEYQSVILGVKDLFELSPAMVQ